MDPVVTAVLALLILTAFWRFRRTFREARKDKNAEIQKKLSELRKKRDEE